MLPTLDKASNASKETRRRPHGFEILVGNRYSKGRTAEVVRRKWGSWSDSTGRRSQAQPGGRGHRGHSLLYSDGQWLLRPEGHRKVRCVCIGIQPHHRLEVKREPEFLKDAPPGELDTHQDVQHLDGKQYPRCGVWDVSLDNAGCQATHNRCSRTGWMTAVGSARRHNPVVFFGIVVAIALIPAIALLGYAGFLYLVFHAYHSGYFLGSLMLFVMGSRALSGYDRIYGWAQGAPARFSGSTPLRLVA